MSISLIDVGQTKNDEVDNVECKNDNNNEVVKVENESIKELEIIEKGLGDIENHLDVIENIVESNVEKTKSKKTVKKSKNEDTETNVVKKVSKTKTPMKERTDLVECPGCKKMYTPNGLLYMHKCYKNNVLTKDQRKVSNLNKSIEKASDLLISVSSKINKDNTEKLEKKKEIEKEELDRLVDMEITRRQLEKKAMKDTAKKEKIKKLIYNII